MSASTGWWGSLGAREQRVVAGGAAIAATALLIVYAVLPFTRSWRAREAAIVATQQQVASLEGLLRDAPKWRAAGTVAETALAAAPQRLLVAGTSALAAAGVQSLVQEYADRSRVTVTRLDVASGVDSLSADGALHRLPVTLTGTTDIFGVAELLGQLTQGPRRLLVDQITVQNNPALRGAPDVLQLTLTLTAPWMVAP
jgi:hypothetical protein